MLIGYDPISGDVALDFEDGSTQLSRNAERVIVKR